MNVTWDFLFADEKKMRIFSSRNHDKWAFYYFHFFLLLFYIHFCLLSLCFSLLEFFEQIKTFSYLLLLLLLMLFTHLVEKETSFWLKSHFFSIIQLFILLLNQNLPRKCVFNSRQCFFSFFFLDEAHWKSSER